MAHDAARAARGFRSFPQPSAGFEGEQREGVRTWRRILRAFEARSSLALVPFAEVQREIVARTLRPLRVVLYRRFMLRIACALAATARATAH